MTMKTLLVVFALIATAVTAAVAMPPAQAATLINNQLVEDIGHTSPLGGGDHVFIRFGSDAAFGIVYGTTANPNNIYVVAIKARYLGLAQVVDEQNRSVAQNRPIKIYTLYAIKLDSLLEFRDVNPGAQNFVADYARGYNTTTGKFSDYYNRGDILYKKVDLNTSWTADPVVRTNGTGSRSWTFNLTARNLSYTAVANYTGSVAGTLPLVRFTFHLNASLEQVNDTAVPQWKVTVRDTAGRTVVTNISRLTDLIVSGKAVHYDLKWDQDIEGWTFAATNPAGNRRRILLEVGAVVGNLIPAAIVDAWFESRVLDRMGEAGTARYNTTAGGRTANATTGTYPAVLQTPNIDFGGNWTRIARFVWVTNSVVDGTTRPVYGQIVAGVRITAFGEGRDVFVGFILLAGLSFRGGASIVHDPTVTSDVEADLQLPASPSPPTGLFVAAIGVVAVIAVLLIIGLLALKRRKKELPPPPPEN